MPDKALVTTLCSKCGAPVSVPAHRAGDVPKEPQHIGVPGNPIECP